MNVDNHDFWLHNNCLWWFQITKKSQVMVNWQALAWNQSNKSLGSIISFGEAKQLQ